jgi:predicted lipid-binding transport protein (Tim44 family)
MTPQDTQTLERYAADAAHARLAAHPHFAAGGLIGGLVGGLSTDALLVVVKALVGVVSKNFSGTADEFLVAHRDLIDSVIPDAALAAAAATLNHLRSDAS